jgi:hypothetical protein
VIMVQNAAEINLAWALIDAVKPHLSIRERDFIFVTICAGDTFAALRQLLGLIAAKRIPLRPHLVQLCSTWLDTYIGHEQEQYLRSLIEGFVMPTTIQASIPVRISRPLTAPRAQRTAAGQRLNHPGFGRVLSSRG